MSKIVIRNIGPLKNVEIDLKKINVFIGPQSSGKSTLVKIICFCKWVEKRGRVNPEDILFKNRTKLFVDELKIFHRLEESYFNENSFFHYIGESVEVLFEKGEIELINSKKGVFPNSKIIYIPSERNLVSAIPLIQKYSDKRDNFLNFVYDWATIKKKYTHDNKLHVLNLGVDYHYNEEEEHDSITLENGTILSIQNASSGVQSVVPLVMLIDYLSNKLFSEKRTDSAEQRESLLKSMEHLVELKEDMAQRLFDLLRAKDYHFSQFFIEEPEQNLFPATQRALIHHIVKACYTENRAHELFLTTHSPYVLFTINNCILASKMDSKNQDLSSIEAMKAPVKSEEVGLWSIKDGELENLQDEDGMLRRNYFDDTMKEIINEHQNMLPFFDEE